jgi:serine/threonine-protein kinase
MGTPLYMSPEQVYGKDVDHRTDIYVLGIIVFQTLTGELPFWGESVMEVMVKQTSAPRPSASAVCADVPAVLDEPIRRMMAKDPAERPESVAAALDALFEAAQEAGLASSASGLVRPTEPSRRSDAGLVASHPAGSSSGRGTSSRGTSQPGASGPGTSSGSPKRSSDGSRTAQASSTAGVAADGLATSDTLLDPRLRLSSPAPRSPLRSAGFGVLALLVVGGAFFAQQRLAATPAADGAAPSASASASAEPPTSARPAAAAVAPSASAPSPAASAAVAAPATVTLTIDAGVPKAEVLVDGRPRGEAPATIELPRGERPVTIELRKPGYLPFKRSIVPESDAIVSTRLVPAPRRPAAPKPPGGGEVLF